MSAAQIDLKAQAACTTVSAINVLAVSSSVTIVVFAYDVAATPAAEKHPKPCIVNPLGMEPTVPGAPKCRVNRRLQ
jgi:hypothetical protein